MTELKLRLAKLNGTLSKDYDSCVEKLIREKYSVSAELAVLRQRDTKPEEFAAYNAYAEECKARAKKEFDIAGGENV